MIRSFVNRQRHLAPTKQKIFDELWPVYGLESTKPLPKSETSTTVEIGFGMGETLLHMASAFPEKTFIGIEVHMPGVGAVLASLKTNPLPNVKIYNADAMDVLENCISDNSIDQFLILFPDPWPKKRHHKRRLIRPTFVELIAKKLKPNGILHIATDWENYAEHILNVISKFPYFTNTTESISRPLTKFEKRGHKLGHKIFDCIFCKANIST